MSESHLESQKNLTAPSAPFHASSSERKVHVNDVDICVETFGNSSDPPILLLAGGGRSMLFWDEDFCRRLALGPRLVIRYDYRDTGRLTCYGPGTAKYSLRDFAEDALGLLDTFGLTKAHLVGVSMGGGISQLMAIEHPDRIASMTLISSSPVGAYTGEPDIPSMSAELSQKFASNLPSDWGSRDMVVHSLVEQYRLSASTSYQFDSAQATARIFDRSTSIQSMMNHGPISFNRWQRERLNEVRAPTLVIHGDEDALLPYPHGVVLSEEIPAARLLTLPGVGHELPGRIWDVILPAILQQTRRSSLRGRFAQNDEYAPCLHLMHTFFSKEGYHTSLDDRNNPYTLVNRTNGLNVFEFIANDAHMRCRFNTAMQAATQGSARAIPIYPFAEELKKHETDDETVLVVDVGGGRGQATMQIKALCPNIKGRMIVEDLPEVTADIKEGIVVLSYDFFTPQPIKGAFIYYIRRCLHDWSDPKTVEILSTIAAAMKPGVSRVLIAEEVVPPSHVDIEMSWTDMILMTFAGRVRTEEHWARALDQAGLRLEKVHGARGTNYGVVEAWLK